MYKMAPEQIRRCQAGIKMEHVHFKQLTLTTQFIVYLFPLCYYLDPIDPWSLILEKKPC